jgi:heptosyltransferase-3
VKTVGPMKGAVSSALVICTRRIGDVLLATPLVRSIKSAYPDAVVDMLVYDGTQDVISRNPDIRRIWTLAERAPIGAQLTMIRSLWRRYDVSLSVVGGDRPVLYACVAGRYRIGALGTYNNSWWKRRLLNVWLPFDRLGTHTVAMNLRLLEPLGIEPHPTPVVGWTRVDEDAVEQLFRHAGHRQRYAVLHVSPKFAYKMWTAAGWAGLGRWLTDQGLTVVVTGGDGPAERTYCEDVTRQLPEGSVNLAGQIGLPALGCLLSRAALFVGTDTAVSHMAAAVGVPAVVLFGPSNPVKWGPWPKDFPATTHSPWSTRGSQRQGNVFLLQGDGACVPCLAEGCGRHVNSLSDCLQNLPIDRVIHAAEQMLAIREDRRGMSAVL